MTDQDGQSVAASGDANPTTQADGEVEAPGLMEPGAIHIVEGLVVRPGDTLVVNVGVDVDEEEVQYFKERLSELLGPIKTVVLLAAQGMAVIKAPPIDSPARPLGDPPLGTLPAGWVHGAWVDERTGLIGGGLIANDPTTGKEMTPERERYLYGERPAIRPTEIDPLGRLTTDPADPRLTHGPDEPGSRPGMADTYLVLPEEERAKGFVRPVRTQYWHTVCGAVTTMGGALAETYARNPNFYGSTYCATCREHRPVGANGEFHWVDPEKPERQSPTTDPKVGT